MSEGEQALVPVVVKEEWKRGRKKGVSSFQTSILKARAWQYAQQGFSPPEIARLMTRRPRTVQGWLKGFGDATMQTVMRRVVENLEAYAILFWTWQTRVDMLAEQIEEYATWGVVEGDTDEPLWTLKARYDQAVAYANRWKQTWESTMLIVTRAMVAQETQGSTGGLPTQLDFPGIEEWYSTIRGYRRFSPKLRGDETEEELEKLEEAEQGEDLEAELDAFEAEYGIVQLPKETM